MLLHEISFHLLNFINYNNRSKCSNTTLSLPTSQKVHLYHLMKKFMKSHKKKANEEDDTTQSPKLQLSKSKDASSSSKEEGSPLKKNVEKKCHK